MKYSDQLFQRLPVIGILRGIQMDDLLPLLRIYTDAGFQFIEITMNTAGAEDMIAKANREFGDRLVIGAGTVTDQHSLRRALDAGASYIVMPITDAEVIRTCLESDVPVFPGAYTPTEIYRAWKLGAKAVKVFPAGINSLEWIRAIRAPLDKIPLIPTGGIHPENLSAWFEAGVFGVGMGSQLFPKDLIARKDWDGIRSILDRVKSVYDNWSEGRRKSNTDMA